MSGVRAIERKLLRDLRRLWAQALAISVVLACGVMVLIMSLGVSDALERSRAAYYERGAFADLFAQARRAPLSLMGEVCAIPGVRAAEARVSRFVMLDMPGRQRPATAQIVSLPEGREPSLNRPQLTFGRLPDPDAPAEVVVGASFAEAHSLRAGDRFAANLGGTRRELTVVGAALSPELVYTIGPGAMMPDPAAHRVIWMGRRAAEAAFDMTGAFDDLFLGLDRTADARAVSTRSIACSSPMADLARTTGRSRSRIASSTRRSSSFASWPWATRPTWRSQPICSPRTPCACPLKPPPACCDGAATRSKRVCAASAPSPGRTSRPSASRTSASTPFSTFSPRPRRDPASPMATA